MHPKWVNQDQRFALLHRRPPCVVKHKLYPGFTRFRGILSLIQVYIFEIYIKFCVFWYPSWGGLKKNFVGPSYEPMRFFEAAPGRASTIETNFFAGFAFFTSKWNYCRVTVPQNKIFIKNQLTLLYIGCPPKLVSIRNNRNWNRN
jgi:hypothetical protein